MLYAGRPLDGKKLDSTRAVFTRRGKNKAVLLVGAEMERECCSLFEAVPVGVSLLKSTLSETRCSGCNGLLLAKLVGNETTGNVFS